MNLDPNIFFVSNKEGVYDFFKTRSIIPFGWLIKLGTDSFFVTDKAENLIEIGCCSACRLFLNIIDVLVSVSISNIDSFKISTKAIDDEISHSFFGSDKAKLYDRRC